MEREIVDLFGLVIHGAAAKLLFADDSPHAP